MRYQIVQYMAAGDSEGWQGGRGKNGDGKCVVDSEGGGA